RHDLRGDSEDIAVVKRWQRGIERVPKIVLRRQKWARSDRNEGRGSRWRGHGILPSENRECPGERREIPRSPVVTHLDRQSRGRSIWQKSGAFCNPERRSGRVGALGF